MKKLISNFMMALVVFGSVFMVGCKYEDGPSISLKSKTSRVANTWKIDKFINEDGEEISGSEFDGWEIVFEKDGAYKVATDFGDAKGTWEFNDDKTKLLLTAEGETEANEVTILRLKEKEFWYKEDGIEYQLVEK